MQIDTITKLIGPKLIVRHLPNYN